jgi:hypothetical protein
MHTKSADRKRVILIVVVVVVVVVVVLIVVVIMVGLKGLCGYVLHSETFL